MLDIASTAFDSNLLERAVCKVARSSDETKKLARRRMAQARIKAPGAENWNMKNRTVKAIVRGSALRSGVAGGGTGLIGKIPGVDTAAATSAGVPPPSYYREGSTSTCATLCSMSSNRIWSLRKLPTWP